MYDFDLFSCVASFGLPASPIFVLTFYFAVPCYCYVCLCLVVLGFWVLRSLFILPS